MTTTQDEIRRGQETKDEMTRDYEEWKRGAMIKMIISLLPPLESDLQRDCFDLLLVSAFDHGCRTGGGLAVRDIVSTLLAPRDKPKD